MQYTLNIHKRNYTSYSLISDTDTITLNDPALISGMFDGDIVVYEQGIVKLVKSNLPKYIAGELELYSKYTFKPNSRGIPSYVFTPIDYRYPKFLVNSSMKKNHKTNLFILIEFKNWTENPIFPIGIIYKTIGSIYDKTALQEIIINKYYLDNNKIKLDLKGVTAKFERAKLETKKHKKFCGEIISIDPKGCTDIDDAFTINDDVNILSLNIHISDVYYLISELGFIDKISNITSIYLSDSVKHMLPNIISSGLGSLLENEDRFMLTLSIKYNKQNNNIVSIKFENYIGTITKNYSYENYPRKIRTYYKSIEHIYKIITDRDIVIDDSHKFIEALMVIYNTYFSKNVNIDGLKIYRTQPKKRYNSKCVDPCLEKFIKLITSNSAVYSTLKEGHASLGIDNYTHVTSPLRRLVDLINQEIYHTSNSNIIQRIPLEDINNTNKRLKKCYRDINKLSLAHDVYNSECYETRCYIYDFNIEKRNSYIYFPDENISIKSNLISYKLDKLYNVSLDDEIITIECKEGVRKIEMNKLLNVVIYGKPNVYDVDKSILIDIL